MMGYVESLTFAAEKSALKNGTSQLVSLTAIVRHSFPALGSQENMSWLNLYRPKADMKPMTGVTPAEHVRLHLTMLDLRYQELSEYLLPSRYQGYSHGLLAILSFQFPSSIV